MHVPRRHYRLLGLAPLLLLSGCSSGVPTVATITTIDRTCTIIEKAFERDLTGEKVEGSEKEVRRYKGDCNEIDDWDTVKSERSQMVDGSADINFLYQGPDGKQHNGTLTFTGQDEEFYDLKAGDPLNIRVAEDDPARFWRG